jgi:hypothetical protein
MDRREYLEKLVALGLWPSVIDVEQNTWEKSPIKCKDIA